MGIPDHLIFLLRNLYGGQEVLVRTRHGTMYWFQIAKGVCQGCILSLCLFKFCIKYIMRTARLAVLQARIKIAGRNISNLRCPHDTTLFAESKEEMKSLLMKVKDESGKTGLKLNLQNTKVMTIWFHTAWQIDGEKVETVADFILLVSQINADGDCHHKIKRCLPLGRKAITN